MILVVLAMTMVVAGSHHLSGDNDWQFFTWGSDTLFGAHTDFVRSDFSAASTGRGGLHVYADYPFLQIGPPALILTKALEIGPRQGLFFAGMVVQGLGLVSVALLERAFPATRMRRAAVLVGGGLVTIVWVGVAQSRHLDDALALTALAGAALTLSRERPLVAGMLVGFAAGSKPWAIPLVALVLVPSSLVNKVRAGVGAATMILTCWLPFVIGDRGTLSLGQVRLPFSPTSALAPLGVSGIPDPQMLRLIQFLGGTLLAIFLVALRSWWLAPLAAFALRLLLEPSPYQYYSVGLVLAALLADMRRNGPPVLTIIATAGWLAVAALRPEAAALTRLIEFAGLILVCATLALAGFGCPRRA